MKLLILFVFITLLNELRARCIAKPAYATDLKSIRICDKMNQHTIFGKYPVTGAKFVSLSNRQYECMHSKVSKEICTWENNYLGFQDILLMINSGINSGHVSKTLCRNYHEIVHIKHIFDEKCKPVLTVQNLEKIYDDVKREKKLVPEKPAPWKMKGVSECKRQLTTLVEGNGCPQLISKVFNKKFCKEMMQPLASKSQFQNTLKSINIELPNAMTPSIKTIKKDGKQMQEIQHWFIDAFISLRSDLEHISAAAAEDNPSMPFKKTFDIEPITARLQSLLTTATATTSNLIDKSVILEMVQYIFENINKRIDEEANVKEANTEWVIPENDYTFSTIMFRYNQKLHPRRYRELTKQQLLYRSSDAISKQKWAQLFTDYVTNVLKFRGSIPCANNVDCMAFYIWTDSNTIAYEFSKTFRCDPLILCCQQLQEKYLLFNMQFKHAYRPDNLEVDFGDGKIVDLKWTSRKQYSTTNLYHGVNGRCLPEGFMAGKTLSFTGPKSFSRDEAVSRRFMEVGDKLFGFMLTIQTGQIEHQHIPADLKAAVTSKVLAPESEVLFYDMHNIKILHVEYWGDYKAQCDPSRIKLPHHTCTALTDISCWDKNGGIVLEEHGHFVHNGLMEYSLHIGYGNILNDELLGSRNDGHENKEVNRYTDKNQFADFRVENDNNSNLALLIGICLTCCVIGCIVSGIGCLFGCIMGGIPKKDLFTAGVTQGEDDNI